MYAWKFFLGGEQVNNEQRFSHANIREKFGVGATTSNLTHRQSEAASISSSPSLSAHNVTSIIPARHSRRTVPMRVAVTAPIRRYPPGPPTQPGCKHRHARVRSQQLSSLTSVIFDCVRCLGRLAFHITDYPYEGHLKHQQRWSWGLGSAPAHSLNKSWVKEIKQSEGRTGGVRCSPVTTWPKGTASPFACVYTVNPSPDPVAVWTWLIEIGVMVDTRSYRGSADHTAVGVRV